MHDFSKKTAELFGGTFYYSRRKPLKTAAPQRDLSLYAAKPKTNLH